ncbi:MAG: tRNA lysidine(34) synthetase TilS [Clostridiales Family XIII bacterium]|jgi:tRNA(Ile)-lysidine synthase|nr:tRNA lysidine(34) synthetase TilS [Clostridiales Family XIII bacterium]
MNKNPVGALPETVAASGLLPEGATVVLGLSGGPDSVCLLYLLAELRDTLRLHIVCAHINHGLRGGDSEADERFAAALCRDLDIPLELLRIDAAALAREESLSVEEAGRAVRYAFFDEICEKYEGGRNERNGSDGSNEYGDRERVENGTRPVIALAHNRDDQAETVFLRLLRGTGPDGVAGIPRRRKSAAGYAIVRPLLDVPRGEIEAWLDARGIAARTDKSNLKPLYARNRIRLEVMPYLEEKTGAPIRASLARLAKHAAEDKEYFDLICAETLGERLGTQKRTSPLCPDFSLPLDLLAGAHPAIRRRLITKVFAKLGLVSDIESVHFAAAHALIAAGETGKSISFPHGYTLSLSYERVVFSPPLCSARVPENAPENVPDVAVRIAELREHKARTVEFGGFSFVFKIESGPADLSDLIAGGREDDTVLLLDCDSLAASEESLVIRTRRDGDRIRLRGMDGGKKLQDLFTDAKTPRNVRGRLPLIADSAEILWIPGLRKSERYAAADATKRVLSVRLTPNNK